MYIYIYIYIERERDTYTSADVGGAPPRGRGESGAARRSCRGRLQNTADLSYGEFTIISPTILSERKKDLDV